mmetsp:Transcript_35799/g.105840  ORF Transcript_35799/g.105840 Transcript_35799/m.105840 type:complete len:212 (+) Transcript_35799:1230-1865(+)
MVAPSLRDRGPRSHHLRVDRSQAFAYRARHDAGRHPAEQFNGQVERDVPLIRGEGRNLSRQPAQHRRRLAHLLHRLWRQHAAHRLRERLGRGGAVRRQRLRLLRLGGQRDALHGPCKTQNAVDLLRVLGLTEPRHQQQHRGERRRERRSGRRATRRRGARRRRKQRRASSTTIRRPRRCCRHRSRCRRGPTCSGARRSRLCRPNRGCLQVW